MEVTYIDHMGSDLRVVNAARVSFNKESHWLLEGFGELDDSGNLLEYGERNVLSETDQKLINYLASHNHWTPFSHVQITLREKVPIFVARQRFKHMVGFTYNEVSRRYVDNPPEFYIPDEWRQKAENKKQGSSDEIIEQFSEDPLWYAKTGGFTNIDANYRYMLGICQILYHQMIKDGVAPEQARMVLPQSMYTEYIVTGSLSAFARAFKLRSDEHAQQEIRWLASEWDRIISNIESLKYSWEALKNN